MSEKGKNGIFAVKNTDMAEYEKKIRQHRLRIARVTVIISTAIVLAVFGLYLYLTLRHYEDYEVYSSVERSDTAGTRFEEFCGNILKYSNDGAFYIDSSNELIWNQTYEMSNPSLDICENFLTIYDKMGTMLYILTPEGLAGSIETTEPIAQVSIAAQGAVAVLTQKDSAGYLSLYDKTGKNLASGAIYGEKGGYPIAIALSHDAIKLAVSMLDLSDGNVKSTVAFYNFGSVGQNFKEHCIGVYSFSDTVIPELEFVSNDRMIAFADTELVIFEGKQSPQITKEITYETKIKSIFYNSNYIGLVTGNTENISNHLTVYNTAGSNVLELDFDMDYNNIEFLSSHEICIRSDNSCDIYTKRGIYKFHYDFDRELCKIIPEWYGLGYTVIFNGETQNIRLK